MNPLLAPVFVGRRTELELLDSVMAEVSSGAGRCVLLSGEAGIGKSRLLAEVRDRASREGYTILSGRCFEQDSAFPFAPLIDMLRPVFAQGAHQERLTTLGPLARELVPEPNMTSPTLTHETIAERRQLFDALTRLLWDQATNGPLLVCVDDLHWGDEASLAFLLHLVRRIADRSMLLLLTSRDTHTQASLVELLTGLDREPIAIEISLEAFTRAEVAALLKGLLKQAQEPSAEFVDALHSLTDGNPLYAEEICVTLIDRGDIYYAEDHWRRKPLAQIDIPDSLQRLVKQRVDRVSAPSRRLLHIAAVSGRSFDFTVLQQLTGHNNLELLEQLKELIAAGLLVEESANYFAFRHALTRETLYGQLLAHERQALHRQLAQAIEKVHGVTIDKHLETLSHHVYEAQMWPQTVDYARRAGQKALSLFAPLVAVQHFSRVVEAAEHLSQRLDSSLYRWRGQAFETLGRFDEAKADYEQALQAARDAGDQRATWQVLLDLGLLWASKDYDLAGDYCYQALELAHTMQDSKAIGHSLNRMGNWLMNSGKPYEALDHHRKALLLFEELGNRAGIAATLDLLAMASNQAGDARGTVAYYEQAIPILRQLQDKRTLSSSLANMALYTLNVEDAQEAVKLAQDIGWQPGEAYALNCLAAVLFNCSRCGESLTIRHRSLALSKAIEHPQWMASNHVYFGYSYIVLLQLDRAEDHLLQGLALSRKVGSSFFMWMGSGLLAQVYVAQRRLEEAQALLDSLPSVWMPALLSAKLARIELAFIQQDHVHVQRLLHEVSNLPIVAEPAIGMLPYFLGPAMTLQAQSLLELGKAAEAEQTLLRAIAQYEAHDVTLMLWQTYVALGKNYLARSRPEQAREMFSKAQALINLLAASIDEGALREDFAQRAAAFIPDLQPLTPRQAAKQEYGGLTRRERQVAAVVAEGLTNQEIADELVVSVKTVEAHVTRILSKLGFTSRVQVAAWAVEKGLASAPKDLDTLSRNV